MNLKQSQWIGRLRWAFCGKILRHRLSGIRFDQFTATVYVCPKCRLAAICGVTLEQEKYIYEYLTGSRPSA